MTTEIRFEIPIDIDEDDYEKYFSDHIDEYSEALDQSAYDSDDRSQVDEISVSSIDLSDDSVTIYYDVEISAYHGCRDVSYAIRKIEIFVGVAKETFSSSISSRIRSAAILMKSSDLLQTPNPSFQRTASGGR